MISRPYFGCDRSSDISIHGVVCNGKIPNPALITFTSTVDGHGGFLRTPYRENLEHYTRPFDIVSYPEFCEVLSKPVMEAPSYETAFNTLGKDVVINRCTEHWVEFQGSAVLPYV